MKAEEEVVMEHRKRRWKRTHLKKWREEEVLVKQELEPEERVKKKLEYGNE